MRIVVVGGGAWGTTLAAMLASRMDTVLWAREEEVVEDVNTRHQNSLFLSKVELPPALHAVRELGEALAGRDVVVMAVPAQHVRSVGMAVAPHVHDAMPVVSLAKGIEHETLKRPTEVLAEVLGRPSRAGIGVLSGPNLAREVAAGQPSATVLAMADQSSAERIQNLFTTGRFRVYVSDDVIGCEVGGAVKNVIAIAAGIADGLGLGWNSRAGLMSRGLAELARLGVALGGDPLTFLGLAGSGDLVATCCSPLSRNRTLGVELGQGRNLAEATAGTRAVVEGVATAPSVLALAASVRVDMPISSEVAAVLRGQRTPADALENLMTRMPTSELHDLHHPSTD
jgi:glycerol-3-phosphate dehydrogenase (NAD(P)+)